MHIAHITAYFNTVLEYQELALIREQIRAGHTVTVFTSDWHYPFPNYETNYRKILGERYIGTGTFVEEGIRIVRLPLLKKPSALLRLKGLTGAIRKMKPDLVICHGFEIGLLSVQAALASDNVIVDCHYLFEHDYVFGKISKLRLAFYDVLNRLKMKLLLQRKVKLVGVAEDSVLYLQRYASRDSRIELIPLGARVTGTETSEAARQEIRSSLGIPAEAFVVCFTGKIEEYKGVLELTEAVCRIPSRDLYLLLIGTCTDSLRERIIALGKDAGCAERVLMHPFVSGEELLRLMSACDAAIYPFGMTVSHFEAMSVNLPIIVEDRISVDHRLKNNNGLRVRPRDVDDIVRAIQALYSDRAESRRMGMRGQDLVRNELNWTAISEKFLSL